MALNRGGECVLLVMAGALDLFGAPTRARCALSRRLAFNLN
jgi:hypothetical protein